MSYSIVNVINNKDCKCQVMWEVKQFNTRSKCVFALKWCKCSLSEITNKSLGILRVTPLDAKWHHVALAAPMDKSFIF